MTPGGDSTTDVSFDKAEYDGAPGAFACASCGQPIDDEYWQLGNAYVCSRCKDGILARLEDESAWGRLARAGAFGAAAAILSGLVWWGVRAATGYEVGLIAIVVGLAVGGAVRHGSRHRGGPWYQALAMFLTYSGISLSYVPDVWKALAAAGDSGAPLGAVAIAFVLATAYAVPFLGGWKNILGLLIIGFALYEAWKINRGGPVTASGPFRRPAAPEGASG